MTPKDIHEYREFMLKTLTMNKHYEAQVQELQECNTRLVTENRELKAALQKQS